MDYFHTTCPACHTRFRISETQLNARNGQVRCGACGQIFNAKADMKKIQNSAPNSITPSKTEANQFPLGQNRTLHSATTAGANRPASPLANSESSIQTRQRDSQQLAHQQKPQNLPRASTVDKTPIVPEEKLTKQDIQHQKKTQYHYKQYNDAEMPGLDLEFMKRIQEKDDFEYSLSDLDNYTVSKENPKSPSEKSSTNDSVKWKEDKLESSTVSSQNKETSISSEVEAIDTSKPTEIFTEDNKESHKTSYNQVSNAGITHTSEVTMNLHQTHHDLSLNHLTGLSDRLTLLDEKHRKWLYILIGLLSLLLIQLFFFYRTEISASMPKLKGVYETICIPFGCEVPLPRELSKITVEGSDMEQAIGSEHNLITLHITLKNHASYSVEYPAIALDVLDQNQKTIARKILYPDDYLNSMKTLKRGLGPDETQLNIRLELQRLEAFGYHLELLYSSSVTY